ncbi:hypothetical protein D5952_14040 [Salmonella enterica subsp. enterica]|nr:hypothetical protein [Salmonella enterica subsp. enterica serovar Bonn]EBZ5939300.1 hypothetical protein [Salmonella enterica subsp. enterica serovar Muenchen]MLZ41044.1 hypothetical protein [Salmonella enterica subsp. enterica serovar Bonn]
MDAITQLELSIAKRVKEQRNVGITRLIEKQIEKTDAEDPDGLRMLKALDATIRVIQHLTKYYEK